MKNKPNVTNIPSKELREEIYLEIEDSEIPADVQIKKRHLKDGFKVRKIHRGKK